MCVCHQLDKDGDTSNPPKTADQVKVNTKDEKVSAVVNNRWQKGNTMRPELVCILQKFWITFLPKKKKLTKSEFKCKLSQLLQHTMDLKWVRMQEALVLSILGEQFNSI